MKIHRYGRHYTRTVNITKGRFNYVVKHVNEAPRRLGITNKIFLNAILETLRTPTEHYASHKDIFFSIPVQLHLQKTTMQRTSPQIIKRMVMRVAINQTTGTLVTAYVTDNKTAVAQAWNTSPWAASHPDGVDTVPSDNQYGTG